MAPVYKCGICNKNVTKNDSGVECETCDTWHHIGCVGIPIDFYNLLGSNKNIAFNCTKCLNNPAAKNVEQKMLNYFSDLDKKINSCINSLDEKITTRFLSFTDEMRNEQQSLRNLIELSVTNIRSDVSEAIMKVQNEVDTCNSKINKIEKDTTAKLSGFDLEHNRLQRKINRADIIISGLPAGIDNLVDAVLKICSFYKIAADERDINHCMYMKQKKAIICKFNSVRLRDELMKAYFKSSQLKLKDVITTELSTRVFLNDNLTTAAISLQNLCRTLKKRNKIMWFRILNKDVPLCVIRLPDGTEKTLNYEQCVEL